MRKILLLFSLLLVASTTGVAQVTTCERDYDGPGKMVPGSPAPVFDLTRAFKHSVPIPNHVLAMLRADEGNADKLKSSCAADKLAEIPPEWFSATEIEMADGELPGLIVKSAKACLWEKEGEGKSGDFWVYRQATTGYQLVVKAHGTALQVLNTRTNGYPDICSLGGSNMLYHQTIYGFKQDKYVPLVDSVINVDYFPTSNGTVKIPTESSPERH